MTTTTLKLPFRAVRLAVSTLAAAVHLALSAPSHAAAGTTIPATAALPVEQLPPSTNSAGGTFKPHEKTEHDKRMELIGISIGAVAAPMGLGIAFFALWIDYRNRRNLLVNCHAERMAALEKGLDLPPFPPELGGSGWDRKPKPPGTGLKPGLMWLGIGIALLCVPAPNKAGALDPVSSSAAGAICSGIGAAYLIFFSIEGRKRSRSLDKPND